MHSHSTPNVSQHLEQEFDHEGSPKTKHRAAKCLKISSVGTLLLSPYDAYVKPKAHGPNVAYHIICFCPAKLIICMVVLK